MNRRVLLALLFVGLLVSLLVLRYAPGLLSFYEGVGKTWQGIRRAWGTIYWFVDEHGWVNPKPSGYSVWSIGGNSFEIDPDEANDGICNLHGEVTDAELTPECRDFRGNPKPAFEVEYEVPSGEDTVKVRAGVYYFDFVIKLWTSYNDKAESDGRWGSIDVILKVTVQTFRAEGNYSNFAAILAIECWNLKYGSYDDEIRAVDDLESFNQLDLPPLERCVVESPMPTIGSEFNYYVRDGDTLRVLDMSYAAEVEEKIRTGTMNELLSPDPRLPQQVWITVHVGEFGPAGCPPFTAGKNACILWLVRVHVLKVDTWLLTRRLRIPLGAPVGGRGRFISWRSVFKDLFGIDMPDWLAALLGWGFVAIVVIAVLVIILAATGLLPRIVRGLKATREALRS